MSITCAIRPVFLLILRTVERTRQPRLALQTTTTTSIPILQSSRTPITIREATPRNTRSCIEIIILNLTKGGTSSDPLSAKPRWSSIVLSTINQTAIQLSTITALRRRQIPDSVETSKLLANVQ